MDFSTCFVLRILKAPTNLYQLPTCIAFNFRFPLTNFL